MKKQKRTDLVIKLIALDLDGTLLDPQGRITEASKAAIAKARAAGVRVVLNTGRPAPETLWFAQEAGLDEVNACLGGAALVERTGGRTTDRLDIPQPSARRVLELCLGREIELMIFAGDEILADPFSKRSLERTYPYPAFHNAVRTVEDPIAYMEANSLPLTKIHGDWNPERYPLKELAALPGVALTSSSPHDFEVVAEGVDKGRSLALLAEAYGVSLEQCAAVGDSGNDLAMLRAAGLPIAMGNAAREVKELAGWIAPPNHREGAAQAILRCLE